MTPITETVSNNMTLKLVLTLKHLANIMTDFILQTNDINNYLFHCPLYTTERCKMLDNVNKICSGNVDLNLLLHGGQTLDYCQNKTIIESVELYILETKRLL